MKSVIILAGGIGSRMRADVPKQFLMLGGEPLLMHSIRAFSLSFPEITIILALPADHFSFWNELCLQYSFLIPHQLVAGGETRFHSVQNALALVENEGLVAIHDGARPLVSVSLIREVFLTAGQLGNCIPTIPVRESLRMISGGGNRAVNRDDYRIVQTPQVFKAESIKKAYQQTYQESFTDDATVVESTGETIHLTDGDPVNLKITHPYDLAAAEILMLNQSSADRG
jgi:2-C-methyl-D-erythritol 4-phosphate cytidylyltransferase